MSNVYICMHTVLLSWANAHPPILTVSWVFEVFHVTAHHAKFLCSELKTRSAELTYIAAIILVCFRRHDIR